jgi:hypothetical protein
VGKVAVDMAGRIREKEANGLYGIIPLAMGTTKIVRISNLIMASLILKETREDWLRSAC